MYSFVIFLHVIACLILITSILLQAGRGGGLSELFGAGSSQTLFGTRASTFLTRATTVAAIVFLLTCISLTIFSSRRVKSLMTGVKESELTGVEEEIRIEEPVEKPEEVQEEKPQESETQPQTPQE